MFRLLVVNNDGNRELEDTARLYIDSLALPMEVHVAADYPDAIARIHSGADYDLLFAAVPAEGGIPEALTLALMRHSRTKAILLSGDPDSTFLPGGLYRILPRPLRISVFYSTLNEILPQVLEKAASRKDLRWLLGHDTLLLQVLTVLKIIHEEYQQNIGLTELAAKVFVSPCYLSTTFSKFIGVSPMVYLNRLRMAEAVNLLTTTTASVTDICNRVGYCSLPYFCTCFKKKYGMTPTQYREQHTSQ